jgi:hypothetical protein
MQLRCEGVLLQTQQGEANVRKRRVEWRRKGDQRPQWHLHCPTSEHHAGPAHSPVSRAAGANNRECGVLISSALMLSGSRAGVEPPSGREPWSGSRS